jgi:hypothetical protein
MENKLKKQKLEEKSNDHLKRKQLRYNDVIYANNNLTELVGSTLIGSIIPDEFVSIKSWYCLDCGEDMGIQNPRQFCGKTRCKNK